MTAILLMGVSNGEWLPILGIMVTPMALYLGFEWMLNFAEDYFLRSYKAHK